MTPKTIILNTILTLNLFSPNISLPRRISKELLRGRETFGDRILVFPGNGQFDVIDVQEIYIDPGNCGPVHKERTMDPDEMGSKEGLPL
jgi:hypothetical protein